MTCIWCGKEIKQTVDHLFCSMSCKHKFSKTDINHRNSNFYARKYGFSKCETCGRDFIQSSSRHSSSCSPKCKPKTQNNSRFNIFKRDNFSCCYCGCSSFSDKIELVLDHIFPEVLGGASTAGNLVTSCKQCNAEKYKNKLPPELQERILEEVKKRNLLSNLSNDSKVSMGQKQYKT